MPEIFLMNKFAQKELAVAKFVEICRSCGMQKDYQKETDSEGNLKPKVYRGIASKDAQQTPIYMRFQVTDDFEEIAADNMSWFRTTYIDGALYSANGETDETFQSLAKKLSEEFEKHNKIKFDFTEDGWDTSLDSEDKIYYIRLFAEITH